MTEFMIGFLFSLGFLILFFPSRSAVDFIIDIFNAWMHENDYDDRSTDS